MSAIDFRYFPDVFADIVSKVREVYDPTGLAMPIFKYGTYLELVASTKFDDDNGNIKYPLVWLVWDSFENTENWLEQDQLYEISPRIFICARVDSMDENTDTCITKYFKPILRPILTELIRQVFFHDNVESYIINKYKKNDHAHWGENYTNKLFDQLSAIEITFEKLRIMKNVVC
ncbi:MAG TPA: hypothetical protein DCS19_01325 [Flavobacterium sp.]|nr:hypothetical protein [Flavobacterium sp.]